jgi:hypothetical protein
VFLSRYPIYKQILTRLLWGWFLSCTVVGGGIFWLETQRVEEFVHQMALSETNILRNAHIQTLQDNNGQFSLHLSHLAEQLLSKHFLMVCLYDSHKIKQLEVLRPEQRSVEAKIDAYRHQFPDVDNFTHEFHLFNGQMWMVMVLPLKELGQNEANGSLI